MKLKSRILALLLTAAVVTSVFTGCQNRTGEESSGGSASSSRTESSQGDKNNKTVASVTPDFLDNVSEKKEENEDTIGWIQVPGTNIDDVVVQKVDDPKNSYYLRLDFNKAKNFNGVYYADFRAVTGDGSRDQLGSNICIYGHAMTDDPENEKYDIKFGHLHDFRDEELAKEKPYLFFSTEKENFAYEVIAVFVANADDVAYNDGSLSQAEYAKMVREEILPRSIYNYDTEIKDTDKFLTLSTCIYKLPDSETPTQYPKTWYRYGIMGKLVDANAPLKTEATFTINEDRLVDKDTYPGK